MYVCVCSIKLPYIVSTEPSAFSGPHDHVSLRALSVAMATRLTWHRLTVSLQQTARSHTHVLLH